MSSPSSCFSGIIGLSRTDCECVEDRPVGANVSESGLFLDELPGMNLRLINATQDCGSDGIWTKMERAVENAVDETVTELMACIAANTDPRRPIGTSQIGEDKKATQSSHTLRHAYHGLTVQTAFVRGGTFKVTGIGTAFKPTVGMPATITLHVYDRLENLGNTPLATYAVPIEGNRTKWTDIEPLVLDMEHPGSLHPRYFFVFEPYAGAQAMNAAVSCNCGGFKPYWDTGAPQYMGRPGNGAAPWTFWAMAAGTYGADLDQRDTWAVENPTSGLMLRVAFECDERSTFCIGTPNYTSDHVQKVLAHAVRFKAGANLLTDLLRSTDINRWTMTDGEGLEAQKKEYLENWEKRLKDYLCPELSSSSNINRYGDCRKCKDTHGMRRGLIRN